MSETSQLRPMTAGERFHVLVVGLAPPLVILLALFGGYVWTVAHHAGKAMWSVRNLSGSLQGLMIVAMVGAVLVAWWIGPALRDVLGGKVLVAEGTLSIADHVNTLNDGASYRHWYVFVTDESGHTSPRCEVNRWVRFRLGRHHGARYRLFIAPHTRKLLHYRAA